MSLSVLLKMCLCLCSLRTALILGCEYACKDAVDVLLKHGADVTAVDGFGHDSYHYARLSKNQELVSLVKSYLDSASKGFVMLHVFMKSLSPICEQHCRAVLKIINWKELKCASTELPQHYSKLLTWHKLKWKMLVNAWTRFTSQRHRTNTGPNIELILAILQ